jgi:ureidoglycolate amidohydrolase
MKLWRVTRELNLMCLAVVVLLVHVTAGAAADESGLCQGTSSDGICKGSARETLFVDGAKLQQQIDELAAFSDTPAPSVTRILYTANDVAARR